MMLNIKLGLELVFNRELLGAFSCGICLSLIIDRSIVESRTGASYKMVWQFKLVQTGVGRIMVPSMNHLWSPVWRLSVCHESGIIFNIHFIMQNPSKILLESKLEYSEVPQTTS